jgi:O-antigen/teichoic acid export membrane protein
MGNIRKQSIVSTVFIYIGFLIGFVNVFFYTKEGTFTPEQFGLIGMFTAVGSLMFGLANMGMLATVYKFYPYYKDNLPFKKIDLLTWALGMCLVGFLLVCIGGYVFKDLVIRKYGNAPLLLKYYYWIFPFGFGLTIFSLFEAFSWSIQKSVATNVLKETAFRLFTTVLIVLFLNHFISDFNSFIKIYSGLYLLIAILLILYLLKNNQLPFSFSVSKVTKRYVGKMITLSSFVYAGNIVFVLAGVIDTIVIGALMNLSMVGLFTFASTLSGIVQAPQRSMVSASMGVLSESWKRKDHSNIARIYKRSSINMLLAGMALFAMIWLNYEDAISAFHIKPEFIDAKWVFFCIGIAKLLDMGTGVNSQIIGTSNYWRFEFMCGVILLLMMIPLNYILVKQMGIIGSGVSNIISFAVYNTIRILFLYRKFKMQPFSYKTLIAILLTGAIYFLVYFLFLGQHGFIVMTSRCLLFIALFATAVFSLHLTPDAWQLYYKFLERRKK